jgi:hypothetical protein
MWYQPVNYIFDTFECFYDTLFNQPSTAAKVKTLGLEQFEAFMADVR